MWWPDSALVRFLWELHWLTLTDDDFRPEGLLSLSVLYAVLGLVFYYGVYSWWQPKIYFVPGDKEGRGRNEIGRVAWVNGLNTGLFQKIFFGWGKECKENPGLYNQGYQVSITYLIGAILLFSMNIICYTLILIFGLEEATWIAEAKWNLNWYANHRPFFVELFAGLPARYFLVMSAIWFFKTWVVRGWPYSGGYRPWPGMAPKSLADLDPSDVKKMPLGSLQMAKKGKYMVYIRPRGGGLGYLFNPIPWKFSRLPDSRETGWIYMKMSHGEIAHHEQTGHVYMKPSDHFLITAEDWLSTTQGHIREELNRAQRDVQMAVKTSAEDQRRQIYDNEVSITPDEESWEEITDYSPFHPEDDIISDHILDGGEYEEDE